MSWGAVYSDINHRWEATWEASMSSDDESWEEWEEEEETDDEEEDDDNRNVMLRPPRRAIPPERWMRGRMMMPPPPLPPPERPQSVPSSSDDDDSDYGVEERWGSPRGWYSSGWNSNPQWSRASPPSPSRWWCRPSYTEDTTDESVPEDEEEDDYDRSPSPPRQRRRIYSPPSPQVHHIREFSPELWRLAAVVARGDSPRRESDRGWNPQPRNGRMHERSPSIRDSSPDMPQRQQWGYESGGNISDDSSEYDDSFSDDSSLDDSPRQLQGGWRAPAPAIHIEISREGFQRIGPHPLPPSRYPPPPATTTTTTAIIVEWPPMLPEITEDRMKRLCEDRGLDPDTFMCPITRAPLRCPAVACDGHTYERGAIHRWLARNDKSPVTGSKMMTRLVPNVSLRTLMYSLFFDDNNNNN